MPFPLNATNAICVDALKTRRPEDCAFVVVRLLKQPTNALKLAITCVALAGWPFVSVFGIVQLCAAAAPAENTRTRKAAKTRASMSDPPCAHYAISMRIFHYIKRTLVNTKHLWDDVCAPIRREG